MKKVLQDKFGAGTGNCFAACLASILEIPLSDIDFIATDEEWLEKTNNYLWKYGYMWMEIDLEILMEKNVVPFYKFKNLLCVLTGKSPRFDCNHCFVAKVTWDESGFTYKELHDPHPDQTYIDGKPKLMGFMIPINPANNSYANK